MGLVFCCGSKKKNQIEPASDIIPRRVISSIEESTRSSIQTESGIPSSASSSIPGTGPGINTEVQEILIAEQENQLETIADVMRIGCSLGGNRACIGEQLDPGSSDRSYKWLTYQEVSQRICDFACGLLMIGLPCSQEARIAVYAVNSSQLLIAELAAFQNSMVVVPLYDRINRRDYIHIMNETGVTCMIVDSKNRTENVIQLLHKTPAVRVMISYEFEITESMQRKLKDHSVSLYSFDAILAMGQMDQNQEVKMRFNPPVPSDLAQICFTSGTTGRPQGVMLTHGNYVCTLQSIRKEIDPFIDLSNELLLSFIPMAHSVSLIAELLMYVSGGRVAIYSGDIRLLIDDLQAVKPTILFTMPRFLDNVYNKIIYSVKGSIIKHKLMALALRGSEDRSTGSEGGTLSRMAESLLQRLVFGHHRNRILGGRVKLIVKGGGPLSPNVLMFLRSALGTKILDSYGMIESCGFVSITHWNDDKAGDSGHAISCCQVKLIDLPGLGQGFKESGVGEICISGDNVMIGYFGNESKNQEKLYTSQNNEHWLRTGDIGCWTFDHRLKIIERMESILKLKTGQLIAPERIESIYNQSAYVSECLVDCDCDGTFLIAIVVPEIDYLNDWCVANDMIMNTEQACRDVQFKYRVFSDMLCCGEREGLQDHEQVRHIFLHPKSFTVENLLLTPVFGTRRSNCRQHFQQIIEHLSKHAD